MNILIGLLIIILLINVIFILYLNNVINNLIDEESNDGKGKIK